MGPAATADFLRRLADATPAKRDQDHIPVIVYADPTTPDRSHAVERGGEDPLPKLVAGIRFLDESGVTAIAIPCNSAHLWYDEMQAETNIPILHIADAARHRLATDLHLHATIGLIGTEATLHSELYQRRLRDVGFTTILPGAGIAMDNLMSGIRAVKAGQVDEGRHLLIAAAAGLAERGAEAVMIACTDISVALADDVRVAGVPIIDANSELALACTRVLGRVSTDTSALRERASLDPD